MACCVIGDGGSDQAPLTVHNVRSQAATADFLQTANQELQVYDRPNHAQKASAIHHRSADQHHRAGGLAVAHNQSLAVIRAAFTGGSIGTFQFALQECIWINAAGGNSFGIGVKEGCVGNVARRRNEVLQQRPEFGSLHVLGADIAAASHLNRRG